MARTRKKNKKRITYYLKPSNLSAEIKSYGAEITIKRALLLYATYIGVISGIGYLLKMKPWAIGIVDVCSLIFIPILIVNTYKNAYEQRRFSDISQYMQHILYGFRGSGKIKTALESVQVLFKENSFMYELIEKALTEMDSPNTEGDPTREALKIIEKEYSCERLRTIHKFLIKVEQLGGTYEQTIDLLLDDREFWVDRVSLLQANKKKKKREVTVSIIVSLLLAFLMNLLMPKDIDITASLLYQIGAIIMMLFDLFVYVAADRKLATDWISQKEIISENTTMKNYEFILNYDEKKERKTSFKFLVIPAILVVIGIITKWIPLFVVAGILIPVMLFQHKLNYKISMKELKEEINLKFPRWLMEITMILQSTKNVQEAIFQSIDTAPIVLVPELNKFRAALREDPTSPKPYYNFMKDFDLPEVSASMNMFYSLSQGNRDDEQRQIAEIISRNHKLLDRAEQEADENSLAMLYLDFLLPQLSVGLMVMVDMVLYIMMFMPTMATWVK